MKMLDEVMKAVDVCWVQSTCKEECPYWRQPCNQLGNDVIHYLKILKAKSEEQPLGNPPDYISLDFHRLAEMVGEPVYIKERGCKGHWEIITAVRKNSDGEDYTIKGNDRWQRIGDCIYRTKEGAHENVG